MPSPETVLVPASVVADGSAYDADYYERGVESGKSCYSCYRWLPEVTIPIGMIVIDTLGIRPGESVLDFGCAKGFLVKALRMLRRDAWGIDASSYAISQAPPEVRPFCELVVNLQEYVQDHRFKHAVAKDVLEHVPYEQIEETIESLSRLADDLLVVVPLGCERPDGNRYVIDAYERDVTHVIREKAGWWQERLVQHFGEVTWRHHISGLKDNWHAVHAQGNAVFECRRPKN
ncbi:MAG: class I SAM-dependent methyltransferase [Phycisphaerales bacterium]